MKKGDIYEVDGVKYEVLNTEEIIENGVKIVKITERIVD